MTTEFANPTPSAVSIARKGFSTLAVRDLIDGFSRQQLWGTLGWQDVRQRYRRSVIGPLWITLSLGVLVLGLGVVYSALLKQSIRDYLPFVAVGIITWTLIAALLTEGCLVFIVSDNTIKQIPFPLSVHVYRELWRNTVVLAHNLIIYLIVLVVFGINPGFTALLALPGIALVVVNGFGFAITLGIFSARFRDIPQLITNLVQLVFFVTPILWQKSILQGREWITEINPFAYLLEIVREPLLGHLPHLNSWLFAIGFTTANVVVALLMYRRYRWRIPYWL